MSDEIMPTEEQLAEQAAQRAAEAAAKAALEALQAEIDELGDLALIIEAYLADAAKDEEDTINFAGFSAEHIAFDFGWGIVSKPKPSLAELQALAPSAIAKQAQAETRAARIQAGADARIVCQKVLDLIAGYNLDRQLSIQEITVLQSTFSSAEAALRGGRPTFAKQFISSITPDGELVTQEMKDEALLILASF